MAAAALPSPCTALTTQSCHTSKMCSWTQSCMPSTQSLQMLDFSGMNFPVCTTTHSWCQSEAASQLQAKRVLLSMKIP